MFNLDGKHGEDLGEALSLEASETPATYVQSRWWRTKELGAQGSSQHPGIAALRLPAR